MSIVDFDGPPSRSLDASETGESTKCSWVRVVEGTVGGKTGTINYNYQAGRSVWRTKTIYEFPKRVARTAKPKHLFLRLNEKQPPFARALTPILQDKKHIDHPENSFEIDATLTWTRSDKWNFLSLKLLRLCSALMDMTDLLSLPPIICCRCWSN